MRPWIVLGLLFITTEVEAEDWISLRKPPDTGQEPAGILIDLESIKLLDAGIRQARVKVDFLSHRIDVSPGPSSINFTIWTNEYDCENKKSFEETMEMHLFSGEVQRVDVSKGSTTVQLTSASGDVTTQTRGPRWFPAANRAADPAFYYVCEWKPSP